MSSAIIVAGFAGGLGAVALCELVAAYAGGRKRSQRRNSGFSQRLLAVMVYLGQGLSNRAPRSLSRKLDAAGIELPVGQLMAIKVGASIIALVSSLTLASGLPTRVWILACATTPTLAFLLPDLWLLRRIRQRSAAINNELADVLELLRVALAAGLGLRNALAEVGARQQGLLATEIKQAANSLTGGELYNDVLSRLQRRCATPGVRSAVEAIRRAQQYGTPLSEPLGALIQQARADSARQALESAARAAPKIQLIVALLLVPSVLMLIAATIIPVFLDN